MPTRTQTNSKSYYDLSNGAIFNDLELHFYYTHDFKVTPLFDVEYLRRVTKNDLE